MLEPFGAMNHDLRSTKKIVDSHHGGAYDTSQSDSGRNRHKG